MLPPPIVDFIQKILGGSCQNVQIRVGWLQNFEIGGFGKTQVFVTISVRNHRINLLTPVIAVGIDILTPTFRIL